LEEDSILGCFVRRLSLGPSAPHASLPDHAEDLAKGTLTLAGDLTSENTATKELNFCELDEVRMPAER
jgi:hypothetical protein